MSKTGICKTPKGLCIAATGILETPKALCAAKTYICKTPRGLRVAKTYINRIRCLFTANETAVFNQKICLMKHVS
ncbi:hypothetical protein QUH73_20145 [Labilibaculum sp. K2S]|uniref:hypothetical protein n=1 Tax=Labilibaculum sp. K2S TaxID=3056386 RepID=UPI0025A455F0|nr:hypothetical protein [Labilibaculum sp. K2S]MDM8162141.1 hypothetical protein [Labilibaculum sp. K2S]